MISSINVLIFLVLYGTATVCYTASPEKLECGENEVYKFCGNHCERRCRYTVHLCIRKCGPPACVCKEGFYRNSEGKCTNDCSKEECDMNMVRNACGLPVHCQASCSSINGVKALAKECSREKCLLKSACECKPGYVLRTQYYKFPDCVPEESCKTTENRWKTREK